VADRVKEQVVALTQGIDYVFIDEMSKNARQRAGSDFCWRKIGVNAYVHSVKIASTSGKAETDRAQRHKYCARRLARYRCSSSVLQLGTLYSGGTRMVGKDETRWILVGACELWGWRRYLVDVLHLNWTSFWDNIIGPGSSRLFLYQPQSRFLSPNLSLEPCLPKVCSELDDLHDA